MALYHSAKGSVNYTIVGNPTIVDGVASGFSSNNYLAINNSFDLSKDNEIVVRAKPSSTQAGSHVFSLNTGQYSFLRFKNDRILFRTYSGSENALTYSGTFDINTFYYIKIKNTNGTVNVSYSTDEISWTDCGSITPENFSSFTSIIFGLARYQTTTGFNGSIDLKETYIKVNGQAWFGVCPVEVQKHQLMGPVGYQISGDGPTVADGWLSGLDGSSSCKTTQVIPSFKTLELLVNVRYPNAVSASYTPVLGFGTGNAPTNRIIANANTGHGIREGTTEIITIDNNTFNYVTASNQTNGYFIKMTVVKNASDYTYTLSLSLDGQTWVSNSANYATNICNDYVSFLRTSTGSATGKPQMNMNISYIKIDNKLWFWQPRETEKIVVNGVEVWTKPQPPVSDYTVHGNPTISGTLVSGFSDNDYLSIDKASPSTINSFEIDFSFDKPTIPSGSAGFVLVPSELGKGPRIYFDATKCYMQLPKPQDYAPPYFAFYGFDFAPSAKTTAKLTWDGTTLSILAKDAETDTTISSSSMSFSGFTWTTNGFIIGKSISTGNSYPGTIDLSKLSITINGTKWWPNNL